MRKIKDLPLDILLFIGDYLDEYAVDENAYYDDAFNEPTYFAAVINEFEMLQHYLKTYSDAKYRERMLISVVKAGNLNAVKYLYKNGCPWYEEACSEACSMAAYEGHMEILQYFHENGCPWDEVTCILAAERGHLEILQYLHENGCPWNKYAYSAATREGHSEILKYLHENGCP